MKDDDWNQELRAQIRTEVAKRTGLPLERVACQPNVAKYAADVRDPDDDERLVQIFELMTQLNQAALDDPRVGNSGGGSAHFRASLEAIVEEVVTQFRGQRLHYVELGPEPSKTSVILDRLLSSGVFVESYVGVDINPVSAAPMKRALSRVLPVDRVHQVQANFSQFSVEPYRRRGVPALVTMLGFQEGNQHPRVMLAWFSSMMAYGDLLLSETQLFHERGRDIIEDFYRHPLMIAFSKASLARVCGSIPSRSDRHLVEVDIGDVRPCWAAVMCEHVGVDEAREQCVITNYCLKPTRDQVRRRWEAQPGFELIQERLTTDQSIAFHLTRRR